MQSEKSLTAQIYFLLTIQRMESFLNETMLQVNKENDQWGEIQKLTFFKPRNFESLKNH